MYDNNCAFTSDTWGHKILTFSDDILDSCASAPSTTVIGVYDLV